MNQMEIRKWRGCARPQNAAEKLHKLHVHAKGATLLNLHPAERGPFWSGGYQ